MEERGEAHGFSGKIAVITGSTQGLGEGVARLMAARNAEGLVLCGRNAVRGEAIAEELSSIGSRTIFIKADLEKIAEGQNVIDQAEQPSDAWTVWSIARQRPIAAASRTRPKKSGTNSST